MFSKALILITGLVVTNQVYGHPHTDVKQQVLLSIGQQATDVNIHIMPSYTEGEDIWYHIDSNRDMQISAVEAESFADKVFNMSDIAINGIQIQLHQRQAQIPSFEEVSAGVGTIKLSSRARYDLDTELQKEQQLTFEIHYEEIAHNWHIQPFYFQRFNQVMGNKSIQRSNRGHRLQLNFSH